MAKNMNAVLAELNALRLPELKDRYQQVLGKETRCPNRTFLVRSIYNALLAQGTGTAKPSDAKQPQDAQTARSAATDTTTATAVRSATKNAGETRADNDAMDANEATVATSAKAPSDAVPARKAHERRPKPEQLPRGRFASMTVEELQGKYLEIVGRTTGSDDRRYLIWKIREAEKGRVPVGPRRTRVHEGEPVEVKILPLRLEVDTVEAMDEAWRTRGIKNRMDFLRRALGHYLTHLGAADAAAKFALAASA